MPDNLGLDYFRRGEILTGAGTPNALGLDYFRRGEAFRVMVVATAAAPAPLGAELYGRPFGRRGAGQMAQILAQ